MGYTYKTEVKKADSSMPKGTWFGMVLRTNTHTNETKIVHIVQGRKADVEFDIRATLKGIELEAN